MIKRFIFFLFLFYFLVLIQTSFLAHFTIFGYVPNIVIFLVIIWSLVENKRNPNGFYVAFFGGLFLDIFSSNIIGFYILILLTLVFLIKTIIKKYVWIPFTQKS